MAETVQVYPAAGRRVRHPVTRQPIGAEGAALPRDSFVERRLADGDLVLTPPAKPAAPDAPAKKK